MKRTTIYYAAAAAVALLAGTRANAQTNIQIQYDFGADRQHVTTTLEGFYNDKWGNTFFFIDHDFNSKNAAGEVIAPSGTYLEIARCLNFWQNTALAPLSVHVEYDGGVYRGYTINNAFLAGIDWFIHSADYRNTLNLKALYKYIAYTDPEFRSRVPMQFTAAWTMKDLFGLKGLTFTGFADFWWEDHSLLSDRYGEILPQTSHCVFISEPQLWYNVGRHFGCENLNVGGEIELSYDFGSVRGFWCRPCAGVKWVF